MPNSFLEVNGVYDITKRYAFTNVLDEDFTSHWDKIPIVVKAGQTIEISNSTPIHGAGQAIAYKMTKEMVDKIMTEGIRVEEAAAKTTSNNPYYRSPRASSLGVPMARKPYEDQILKELSPDEESPDIQAERKRLLAEITQGVEAKTEVSPPTLPSTDEFAEIKSNNDKISQVAKPAAKVKIVK